VPSVPGRLLVKLVIRPSVISTVRGPYSAFSQSAASTWGWWKAVISSRGSRSAAISALIIQKGCVSRNQAAWRKARNVPETKDDYKYALSDEMAVKLGPLDETKLAAFRDYADKKDWSNEDFKDALDFYHNNMIGDIDSAGVTLAEHQTADAKAAKIELMKNPGWHTEQEYQDKVNTRPKRYGEI